MAILYAYKCYNCGRKEDLWLKEPDELIAGEECSAHEKGCLMVRDWSCVPGTGFVEGAGGSKAKLSRQV